MLALSTVLAGRDGNRAQVGLMRWQCRRGMRELDELLLDYLDRHYSTTSETEKEAFRALLELSNRELIRYLLHKEKPAAEPLARVVKCILNRTPD